ncbi:MAG: hypothetical protein NT084_14495 [Bacteroidetes bacterium]|nr:hypothetical protein [Bacteroidota bacterium]
MEKINENEIYLFTISGVEYLSSPETYPEYSASVEMFLRMKKLFETEEALLKRLGATTIEEVLLKCPDRFISATTKTKDGKVNIVWFDIWANYFFKQDDNSYDYFFAKKLSRSNSLAIENILNYHKNKWDESSSISFERFVRLATRSHLELFEQDQVQTINEWIDANYKTIPSIESVNAPSLKAKGRLKRTKGDNKTVLTEEQTTILVDLLQKEGVFLREEYLNKQETGRVIGYLTGYSPDSLRISLGEEKLKGIYANKGNLKEVFSVWSKINNLISSQLKGS